jgi:hypothetical protein
VDLTGTRHIPCGDEPISYFHDFVSDITSRTTTAVPQSHVFTVCRLALEAQARATRFIAEHAA